MVGAWPLKTAYPPTPRPPSVNSLSSHDVPGRETESRWSHPQVPSLGELAGRWEWQGIGPHGGIERVRAVVGHRDGPARRGRVSGRSAACLRRPPWGCTFQWNAEWPVWTTMVRAAVCLGWGRPVGRPGTGRREMTRRGVGLAGFLRSLDFIPRGMGSRKGSLSWE